MSTINHPPYPPSKREEVTTEKTTTEDTLPFRGESEG